MSDLERMSLLVLRLIVNCFDVNWVRKTCIRFARLVTTVNHWVTIDLPSSFVSVTELSSARCAEEDQSYGVVIKN